MEKEKRSQKKKRKKDEGQKSEGSEKGGEPHSTSNYGESGLDQGHPDNDDSDSQEEMSDLEDLPEYERELILAKRHEEHMIKEHRRILLKKVKPQLQSEKTDQDDDTNHVVQGGKSVGTALGNPLGSNPVGSTPLGSTAAGGKNAPKEEKEEGGGINTTSAHTNQNNQKNIFFITNVVKSENYFCIDRHTNVKFELAHLENIENAHFFTRIKSRMIKNKKLQINELSSHDNPSLPHGGSTFLCDLNNICDQKFSVDEYNCIKLFSIDVQILKNFYQFLREKIEDLKNFRYTDKQIADLVEMKKKQSFHEIFSNKKGLDSVPISRITVQREICSIQREIDTLNYSMRRTNPRDHHALSQLGHQIDALTRKKDILKGQLQKARSNTKSGAAARSSTAGGTAALHRLSAYLDDPPADSSEEESGEDYHLFGGNK
ncbi:hypothetical protein PCYB_145130 [Plasmodium cynomolgi strain B]|uniref:Uncharacterized protein n=1 Tax=Plasmodium cynomolgi (strain B) TaxID=1120755 RepID=K6V1P6_PLACD|nr:hypothetical protein PCYB_145130 [Plasmodium cynomolgi strain B]GAB69085.1 hypothetical protein PCYB_145130 [Plasmodium cynomolgi strain B]